MDNFKDIITNEKKLPDEMCTSLPKIKAVHLHKLYSVKCLLLVPRGKRGKRGHVQYFLPWILEARITRHIGTERRERDVNQIASSLFLLDGTTCK